MASTLNRFFSNLGYNIKKEEGEQVGGIIDSAIEKTFSIFKPQNPLEAYSLVNAAVKLAGQGALPAANLAGILNLADPYIKSAIEDKFNVFEGPTGEPTMPSLTTGSRGNLSPTEIKAQYAKENIYQGTPPDPIYSDVTALTNIGLSDESIKDEIAFRGGNPYGVDFALAQALANEIGDYYFDDTMPTTGAPTPYASITATPSAPLAVSGNPLLDASAIPSRPLTVDEMISKVDNLTSIQDDINAAEAGSVPVGVLDTAYFDDELTVNPVTNITTEDLGIPNVMSIDLSPVFGGGNNDDPGHNAPSGGYKSYSGEDVEASYSVPDSKPSGQSSGNWNTTARQVSTAPTYGSDPSSDSGNGGK